MSADERPPDTVDLRRYQRPAVIAGVFGLVGCALGIAIQPDQFFRAYLWAFSFFLGVALGSLVLLMLQYLIGGIWGLVIRRILMAGSRTIPIMAVLFLPIAAGFLIPARHGEGDSTSHSRPIISGVYLWADHSVVEQNHALEFKAKWYLNVPFFLVRASIYFIVWIAIAIVLDRWTLAADSPVPTDTSRLSALSAGGMILYAVTISFASVDWIMSLEPLWVSSIFGGLIGVGQILNGLSIAVLVLLLLSDRPPLSDFASKPVLRDLGSIMLSFVMVWAYLAFSQFLLIWSGNLPSEIPYYLRRLQGGWQYFALALVLLQFALPFVLLLRRDIKRDRARLLRVVVLIVIMRAIDLYWLIAPAQPNVSGLGATPFSPSIWDLIAPIGVGGIWLAVYIRHLYRYPLMPSYDVRLEEALHHE